MGGGGSGAAFMGKSAANAGAAMPRARAAAIRTFLIDYSPIPPTLTVGRCARHPHQYIIEGARQKRRAKTATLNEKTTVALTTFVSLARLPGEPVRNGGEKDQSFGGIRIDRPSKHDQAFPKSLLSESLGFHFGRKCSGFAVAALFLRQLT